MTRTGLAQVVKGWLEDGETRERVYDVVCSDGLAPDPEKHRCADNGARVNLDDCSISRDKGAVELRTTWIYNVTSTPTRFATGV